MQNALEFLSEWLEKNGYDGLESIKSNCTCEKDNLQTCDGPLWKCKPWKREDENTLEKEQ